MQPHKGKIERSTAQKTSISKPFPLFDNSIRAMNSYCRQDHGASSPFWTNLPGLTAVELLGRRKVWGECECRRQKLAIRRKTVVGFPTKMTGLHIPWMYRPGYHDWITVIFVGSAACAYSFTLFENKSVCPLFIFNMMQTLIGVWTYTQESRQGVDDSSEFSGNSNQWQKKYLHRGNR